MKSTLKIVVMLCFILSVISADKAVDKVLISQIKFFEGIYKHNDRPVTGEIIDYYENKVLKFTYSVLEGRLHGQATEYYKDGSIRSVRHYTLSKLFGEFIEYFENGDVKLQFKVGLNAYGQGEKITEIKIAKENNHKLKNHSEGILLFIDEHQTSIGTSEEISILNQSNFKIVDLEGQTLFQH